MDAITQRILDALRPFLNEQHGANRYNTPWRTGADGGTLSVVADEGYGLGLKWYDHKDGTAGNGWTLARLLGIQVGGGAGPKDSPFESLADYAHAHGVPVDVFEAAGWDEQTRAGHKVFAFVTSGGIRYRYADPAAAKRKYDSEKGYRACWYGLERAVAMAQGGPLILCNGEASTVAAQHHRVPACCVTGGEKATLAPALLEELRAAWSGPIRVAFDCDTTGRKASKGLAHLLRDAGFDAEAIDLRGADGYDLADFCRLHNGTSAEAVLALPALAEAGEVVRLSAADLAQARPVGGLPDIISAAELARKTFAALVWTVDGLLPEGACLLAAKPKAKKSWLALAIAIAVASGGKVLGYFDVTPGEALYLDIESNQRRMQSRLNSIIGPGQWPENLHIADSWGRGDDCLRQIEAYVGDRPKTRVIVIDILARVRPPRDPKADPYEQDYTFLQALNALAERLRITIIIIHHTRKAKADDVFEEVSGTQAITGAVATIWMLTRSQENPDEQMLYLRGRDLIDEDPLAIRWDGYTCQHTLVATGVEASSSTERRKLLDAMDEFSEYQLKDLAALIGKTVKATDNLLRRLVDDNAVQRTGRGRYGKVPRPVLKGRGIGGIGGIGGSRGNGGFDEVMGPENSTPNSTNSTTFHMPDVEFDTASGRQETPQNGEFHEFHEDRGGALDQVPASRRTVLRLYLRSQQDKDQERARELCEQFGIDYQTAKREAEAS